MRALRTNFHHYRLKRKYLLLAMVLHYVFLNGRNGFFLLKAKFGFLRKSTASYSIGELSTPQTYSSTKKYAAFQGNQFGRGYESHSKKDLAAKSAEIAKKGF